MGSVGTRGGRSRAALVRGFAALLVALVVGVVSSAVVAPRAEAATILYRATPLAGYQTNGAVRAVLVVGDTIYVGGSFTQVRGPNGTPVVNRANLAAFDRVSGVLRTGFSADTNNVVRSLATDGTALYAGGSFTTIRGLARSRIAKVDLASGAVSAWTANVNGIAYSIGVSGNRLYAGGTFSIAANQPRSRLAAFDTTSGALDAFNPGADNTVNALAFSPDQQTVYVGGNFANIAGTARPWLAALTRAGAIRPIAFQYLTYQILDLDVSPDGSRVFAAQGGFGNQATSYNAVTGQRQWFQVAEGDVQTVRYAGGEVYFGFHEGFAGNFDVRMRAADAQTGALDTAFLPTINSFWGVWDITSTYDQLVIGGEFTRVNGVNQQGVAILPSIFGPDGVAPSVPSPFTGTVTATSVALTWGAATDNTAIEGYRVLRDGVPIGFATTTSFVDSTALGGSEYQYVVQAVDVAGNESAASAVFVARTPIAYLAPGAIWRYRDNGSDQGTAWRGAGFDASSWSSGAQELGYGDGDEATIVSFGPSATAKYRTTYFRRTFDVADPARVLSLAARLIRDDGAVVYLNGTEVLRTNLPAGTINSATYANGVVDGANERTPVAFAIDAARLVAGTNTIAVEVHQNSGGSSDISFALELDATLGAADVAPPSAPTSLHVVDTTASTASLAWNASTDDVGVVDYVVLRGGAPIATVTSPAYVDAELAPATAYTYAVVARDEADNSSAPSGPAVATTRLLAPANLAVTATTPSSITLAWDTVAGAAGGYRILRDGAPHATTPTPGFTDSPLPDGASHQYAVTAIDAAARESVPAGPVAGATPDVTAPSIPAGLAAVAVQDVRVTIAWDAASDNVGVTSYRVLRDGLEVGVAAAATTFVDSGLTPETPYEYTLVAVDAAANESVSSAPLVVTTLAFSPDSTPPSVPTGLAALGATTSSITLGWQAATDDTAVSGYRVYRDGSAYAVTVDPTYTDAALVDGEGHSYAVSAFDASTNESDPSTAIVAAALDGIAPTQPTGLGVVGATSTTITLSWNAASDNIAVTGYEVRRNDVVVATTSANGWLDTGRLPNTSATYAVVALDAAGNRSVASAAILGATLPATATVIAANATWRYLDNGTDQGTAWRAVGFDASAWAAGAGQFGYGDGDEGTVVAFGPNAAAKYITTYFRTTFDVTNPATAQSLTVLLQRDDGAVVYLNGVELVRSNLPAGTIVSTTRAATNIEGAAEAVWNTFAVPSAALVAGTNVVAVEVHQQWAGSSDLSFNLQLLANQ